MCDNDILFHRIADRPYDPVTGTGCAGDRVAVNRPGCGDRVYVPRSMTADGRYNGSLASTVDFDRLRLCHDFEFWAVTCCNIRDKNTGLTIPFRLNNPQRYVVSMFEEDRVAGRPMRFIMLKARQWGGSTLVQMYMAWIQCTQRCNWNSLICAHVKDTSATIRGMYSDMLAGYPREFWMGEEGSEPAFKGFERSINVREISGCRVNKQVQN